MTSEPGSQTIPIHILINIAGSKGNQTIFLMPASEFKSDQLEVHYTKSAL